MLVYRICVKEEIDSIMKNKSLNQVAMYYVINHKINTFDYYKNKKYIHFYENYGDVFYYDSNEKKYICTYDIDKEILNNSQGYGYYLDRFAFKHYQKVKEYAVESDLIDFSNLIKVEVIKSPIFYDEYLDDCYQDKIKTIYDINKPKVLTLKKRNNR